MDSTDRKKILIIEDEELVREGIIELLDSEGFEVIEAGDGTTGLRLAQQIQPELIICDVMMPGLNGFQVLDALQANQVTSTIPFIFLTAKSERADMRYGMDMGADDFITKPFKSDELFHAVQSRLHKSKKHEFKTEEKLNDLRKNIATILPHELRTPLNGVLASSQLLLEYYDSMEEVEIKQLHENIYTSAKRLNRLIVNYLYYSELELLKKDSSRITQFKKSSHSSEPSSIISDVFTMTAKNYIREADLFMDLCDAEVDIYDDHLKKICEELSDNAFKFSAKDQKVAVKTQIIDNSQFRIIIKDHGRGMSDEQRKNIGAYIQFERNIYEQQGSGLGLIISKRLLEIYNGKMTMDSVLDESTTMTLDIPLKG